MKTFYVYVYCNPMKPSSIHKCGFEPFYVGKGQFNRDLYHMSEGCLSEDTNRHKVNTIKQIQLVGLTPIVEREMETNDEEAAYSFERLLIAKYGRRNLGTGVLTNLTDGGEGKRKFVTPKSTKELISAKRKDWLATLSEDERKEILGTMKNRTHTEVARERMSVSIKQACAKEETKLRRSLANAGGNNPRAKSIELLGVKYSCIADAVEATGIHKKKLKSLPTFKYL